MERLITEEEGVPDITPVVDDKDQMEENQNRQRKSLHFLDKQVLMRSKFLYMQLMVILHNRIEKEDE